MSGYPWVSVADPAYGMTQYSGSDPARLACIVDANRTGLEAALHDVVTHGGGTLYFPAGRWPINRTPTPGKSYCLLMQDVHNVRFLGEPNSVLAVAGDQGADDTYMIQMVNTSGIRFEGMTFSQRDCTNTNEQNHMVQIGGSSVLASANDDIQFIQCNFIEGAGGSGFKGGDGVRILGGSSVQLETRIIFDGCTFKKCFRSGIGVQRGSQHINIINCFFSGTGDQDVDFEPSGTTQTGHFFISGNHFERTNSSGGSVSVSLFGATFGTPDIGSVFAYNTLIDGTIQTIHLQDTVIQGNHFYANSPQVTDPILRIDGIAKNVTISDNYIFRGDLCGDAELILITRHNTHNPEFVAVRGNILETYSPTKAPIHLDSVLKCDVTGNRFMWHGTSTKAIMIQVQSSGGKSSITCDGNYVEAGFLINGTTPASVPALLVNIEPGFGGPVGQVIVTDNRLKGVAGILRDQNTPTNHVDGLPMVTGNVVDSVCTSVVGGTGNLLTYWYISGTAGLFGYMTGTITPEGAIAAPQGTTYVHQNGNASLAYFKKTGTSNSGWVIAYP